ncbi:zinc finger and BTB [Bonamia ostreae]|uniref:Zinc finger and BTB n=1 Tax=Bonamia ostreae TaxID=126728 RepID=A0ABV2AIF2_9EUKA
MTDNKLEKNVFQSFRRLSVLAHVTKRFGSNVVMERSKHDITVLKNIKNCCFCKFCCKVFAKLPDLNRHLRTHTGERPYECDVCSKAFSDKRNLMHHNQVHTKSRPFVCDACDKAFARMSHLKLHFKTHESEGLYRCEMCLKRLDTKEELRLHRERHEAGNGAYRCRHCKVYYRLYHSFQQHLKTAHGTED